MTGKTQERRRRLPARLLVACAALAVAGCTGNTYGTGTSPGMQTLQDLTGIVSMSGQKKDPIDYSPRAKLVAPPAQAQDQLPPPQTADNATPANWPADQSAARAKVIAEADAREAAGKPLPQSVIDAYGQKMNSTASVDDDHELTPEELAKVKKLFADAKGGVAVDANGNPIRRYLSDPPSEYRLPDPSAPVDPKALEKTEKKPFKWWWQQDASASTAPASQ